MNIKNKKIRIAAIVSASLLAALLLVSGILESVRQSTASTLLDQAAAERWGGETSAQLSCFFAVGSGFEPGRAYALQSTIEDELTGASLAAPDGARLWYHAYSAETTLFASTTRDSAKLKITAFGGDYFYIHQPTLIAGSYLSAGGGNAGYVFLDQNAAWKLFGAIDVVGMPVTIGDSEYTVCGVGEIPTGTLYDEAYGTEPRGYILIDSPAASQIKEITSYEIVLPNPIDGFARSILEENFTDSANTVIVENSTRFNASALLDHLKNRTQLGVRTSPVTYPWYENVAIVTEYRCATIFAWQIALIALALLIVLGWIVLLWNPVGRACKRILHTAWDAMIEKYNALTRPKKYRNT